MDLFVGTSMLAAFIAGVAALFAPCCITVLLPSYLASIFRERKKVFLMTFIFFLGILVVFLPMGLGVAALGQALRQYHNVIFLIGGLFLLGLGVSILAGKRWTLPWHVNPALKSHHPLSVFVLGILSGIATTCCAPVLAGVLALSALPGSVLWGGIYTLAYVLGMVAPLFVLSVLLDRTNATAKLMRLRRTVQLFGGRVQLAVADLVSGILFVLMGGVTIGLTLAGRLMLRSNYQIDINIWMAKLTAALQGVTRLLPESVWAGLFLVLFLMLVLRARSLLNREHPYEKKS